MAGKPAERQFRLVLRHPVFTISLIGLVLARALILAPTTWLQLPWADPLPRRGRLLIIDKRNGHKEADQQSSTSRPNLSVSNTRAQKKKLPTKWLMRLLRSLIMLRRRMRTLPDSKWTLGKWVAAKLLPKKYGDRPAEVNVNTQINLASICVEDQLRLQV